MNKTDHTAIPVLQDYERTECIATAGIATVWKGRHTDDASQDVAIKQLHPYLHNEPLVRARFVREAMWGQAFAHPNLLRVNAWGVLQGILSMVMPYVPSVTLQAWLLHHAKTRTVQERTAVAVYVVEQVARALAYLHTREPSDAAPSGSVGGIVHGDVAPDNILIDRQGRVYVIDLGNANRAGDPPNETLRGKLPYMAPEQCAQSLPDPRWDLYVLGTVLWEIIRGQAPYPSDNRILAIRMLTEGYTAPPLVDDSILSVRINALWQHLCERNPLLRAHDAQQIADECAAIAAQHILDGQRILAVG